MPEPITIPRADFKVGHTHGTAELHISGGLRAVQAAPQLWSLQPVLSAGKLVTLKPFPMQTIDRAANDAGEYLFGGDQISDIGTPLVSRMWTPLNGPHKGGLQTADLWSAIANHANDAGDTAYSRCANNIAHSLRAAGIRLRDASDGFHNQLVAAISAKKTDGTRFSNVAAADIHLAFHSVLSELASARDYLAASLACKLGAPPKVEAMNRFAQWLDHAANAHAKADKIVAQTLSAYDSTSKDPWLYELTEYRNEFLHRSPLGSAENPHPLQLRIKDVQSLQVAVVHMPLSDDDRWAPGEDAFKKFITLYRRMIELLTDAAEAAPYDTSPPSFIVSDD